MEANAGACISCSKEMRKGQQVLFIEIGKAVDARGRECVRVLNPREQETLPAGYWIEKQAIAHWRCLLEGRKNYHDDRLGGTSGVVFKP